MEKGKFSQIRKAIEHNRHLTSDLGLLKNREGNWGIYDSDADLFGQVFSRTLPAGSQAPEGLRNEGRAFVRYIERTLSEGDKKNGLCAVEFGGPGSQFFRSFSNKFFERTAGVCLSDQRQEFIADEDRDRDHNVIVGDIIEAQSPLLDKVKNVLRSEKVDLIISKMEGPLRYIDFHDAVMDRIVRDWYRILAENGLMFVEFAYTDSEPQRRPIKERTDSVIKWAKRVQKKFPTIEIQIDISSPRSHSAFRLHKRKGSPEELPRASELFK